MKEAQKKVKERLTEFGCSTQALRKSNFFPKIQYPDLPKFSKKKDGRLLLQQKAVDKKMYEDSAHSLP